MDFPTWTWCIATYNRHDILERACSLAVTQSVPPSQLVITDASENWEEGRQRLEKLLERAAQNNVPVPVLSYEKASKASASAQRNESISRSTSDILVMFDDDTMMFPDTIEKILEVYSADTKKVIQAVSARGIDDVPPCPAWANIVEDIATVEKVSQNDEAFSSVPKRSRNAFVTTIRKFLRADDRFVPYDPNLKLHEIPKGLEQFDLRSWATAAGYHLTARREAALREPFEDRLTGYSPGEDSDITHRFTRHGPIIHRIDALIHHMEAPGARFGLFRRTALGALNPLLLHRVHSVDLVFSERENRAVLRRRLVIEFAKDIQNQDFRFSRTRGIAYALRQVKTIMRSPDDQIDAMFDKYQSI